MTVLLPTHQCFDDVAAYTNARCREARGQGDVDHLRVVHGLCFAAHVSRSGASQPPGLFAHAWVLDTAKRRVLSFALEAGALVTVCYEPRVFYRELGVIWQVAYTVREVAQASRLGGASGPWRDEVRRHCADAAELKGVPVNEEAAAIGTVTVVRAV